MATASGCSPPPRCFRQVHKFPDPQPSHVRSCLFNGNGNAFRGRGGLRVPSSGRGQSSVRRFQFRASGGRIRDSRRQVPAQSEIKILAGDASNLIHVQTLRNFPKEKLKGEVVAVRFDSTLMLDIQCIEDGSVNNALYTIKYLHDSGAKVILLSSWEHSSDPSLFSTESFAEYLSSLLQLKVLPVNGTSDFGQLNVKEMRKSDILLFEDLTKFKGEVANSLDFAKKLSADVGVFVNDSFSLAHKILASTVGISQFCYSSVAGFHFEEEWHQLASIAEATGQPYIAIVCCSPPEEKI